MDPFWYNSPKVLFMKTRLKEFWPNKEMTMDEKLNSITRFILYSCGLLTIYNNDPSFLIAGLCLCALIAIIVRFKLVRPKKSPLQPSHTHPKAEKMTNKRCAKPTKHNPFANVSMADYKDNVERSAACYHENVSDEIDELFYHKHGQPEFDPYNRRADQRQFFSNPVTTIPNDSVGFASWLYGKGGTCKEDPSTCTGSEAGMRSGGGVS